MTISACGGSACIADVSRDCGHGIFRLEGGATRSQTRRDTNFAIPGYSISAIIPRRGENQRFFCLWSFMWSKPLLYRFRQPGEILQTQASQGFAAFRLAPSRIPPRHSQSRYASAMKYSQIIRWGHPAKGQTCHQNANQRLDICTTTQFIILQKFCIKSRPKKKIGTF